MPHLHLSQVSMMPHLHLSQVSMMPHLHLSQVSMMPHSHLSQLSTLITRWFTGDRKLQQVSDWCPYLNVTKISLSLCGALRIHWDKHRYVILISYRYRRCFLYFFVTFVNIFVLSIKFFYNSHQIRQIQQKQIFKKCRDLRRNWAQITPNSLLTFIDKYDIPGSQWTWLYETLLEISVNKIALWIRVCADD